MTDFDIRFKESDDKARSRFDRAWELHLKEHPPGSLNLPPLLEQRRLEHKLATGFFQYECLWDYVLIAQISYQEKEDELIAGTGLVRPRSLEDAERRQSFIGIICSAGSTALDKLESEGVGLGHIVRFLQFTPWHAKVDTLAHPDGGPVEVHGIDLTCTAIRSSLDLAAGLRSGKCKRVVVEHEDGRHEHLYEDEDGRTWKPQTPVMMENW